MRETRTALLYQQLEKKILVLDGAMGTMLQAFKPEEEDSTLDMRMERVENVKDVKNYLERVDEMIERKIKKMNEIGWMA